jgi:adenine-specific DNA methylase
MSQAMRRKRIGAFYTPRPLAAKLVEWGVRSPLNRVLDPSFGGGVFLSLAKERLLSLGADRSGVCGLVYGVDNDASEACRIDGGLDDVTLIHSDFFALDPMELPRFTANLGNPPYVRYQDWDANSSAAHAISAGMGVKLSRLASLWAPFILHGCRFLEVGGRLGQVLPAEFLHAQYARPIVDYLLAAFRNVTVVVFEERIFPGALEEVVLLFAEGYGQGPAAGMGVLTCRNIDDLDIANVDGVGRGHSSPQMALLRVLPAEGQRAYERLAQHESVVRLGDIADVDIGAVTGANEFFIRHRTEIGARGFAPELFRTVVSKASDLRGARLAGADIGRLADKGKRTELLVTNGHNSDQLATVAGLLAEGEALGLPLRYKCRIRKPWWAVPLPKGGIPDAFLTYMSNAHPRLVCNDARALSTNTVHNVAMRDGRSARALAVAFYNSLTLLSAEIVGRSYGGGILKLEPTEAEQLLIPIFEGGIESYVDEIDGCLRAGDLAAALRIVDPLVLGPLGLTDEELAALRVARAALQKRRVTRSKGPRP